MVYLMNCKQEKYKRERRGQASASCTVVKLQMNQDIPILVGHKGQPGRSIFELSLNPLIVRVVRRSIAYGNTCRGAVSGRLVRPLSVAGRR